MKLFIRTISTILASATTTGITFYVAWDYIFSIPLLKSIAGIASVIAIVLFEIVFIIWYFSRFAQKQRSYKEEEEEAKALPPGSMRTAQIGHIAAPPIDTTNTTLTKKSSFAWYIPLIFLFIAIVSIAGGISTLIKVNTPTAYLSAYGLPNLIDPLHKPGQWNELHRDFFGGSCQFAGNALHVRQLTHQQVFACPSTPSYKNFAFEVEMTLAKGDCGGINVRNDPDRGTGYIFQICQNGTYTLTRSIDLQNSLDLLPTSHTLALHTGLKSSNLLAIVMQGNTISLYINREQVAQTQDDSYSEGTIALLAISEAHPTEAVYDNAKIWLLE